MAPELEKGPFVPTTIGSELAHSSFGTVGVQATSTWKLPDALWKPSSRVSMTGHITIPPSSSSGSAYPTSLVALVISTIAAIATSIPITVENSPAPSAPNTQISTAPPSSQWCRLRCSSRPIARARLMIARSATAAASASVELPRPIESTRSAPNGAYSRASSFGIRRCSAFWIGQPRAMMNSEKASSTNTAWAR